MINDSVNDKCDKAVAAINNCGLANFISDEECKTLAGDILTLKTKQDRSLASELSALHENNLKQYIKIKQSAPDYSQDFVKYQIECISLLNEIEAALYVQDSFK